MRKTAYFTPKMIKMAQNAFLLFLSTFWNFFRDKPLVFRKTTINHGGLWSLRFKKICKEHSYIRSYIILSSNCVNKRYNFKKRDFLQSETMEKPQKLQTRFLAVSSGLFGLCNPDS